jgi:pimeloyl-ACP methyl ester carboxylesterase
MTQTAQVPVTGGTLAVELCETSSSPILAIHGISSQRKLFNWISACDPRLNLIAPDLRGRGESVAVAGPFSIDQHVEDMVAVLDHLGLDTVTVCGMSMGGFVGVELAAAHPDRVASLFLIDGGFPMPAPPGLTKEMLPLVFKDRLARLEQGFASLEDYAAFFVANTAPLLDPTDPVLIDYLRHDLVDGQIRLSADALLADAAGVFFDDNLWQEVDVPTRLVYAEWSTGEGSPPAYSDDAVAGFRDQLSSLVLTHKLDGVDHAATVMTKNGADAIAPILREATG